MIQQLSTTKSYRKIKRSNRNTNCVSNLQVAKKSTETSTVTMGVVVSIFLLIKVPMILIKELFNLIPMKEKENLWENPPEASPEMKSIFKEFKHTFKSSDKWDGNFVL